jgi:two-component system, cell cycle sensor histidine kinase and response regulator CckA
MPGMNGADTLDGLKKINPELKVLLSSDYSAENQARTILKRGCQGFIQKPYTLSQLSQRLDEILQSNTGSKPPLI